MNEQERRSQRAAAVTMPKQTTNIISIIFSAIDNAIELYLGSFIKPFLRWHEVFYASLNKLLRKLLDDNASKIPQWFTANFITYFRTALVIPTLLFLAWEYWILSAIIVLLVDFGDFLDGVVARYWRDRMEIQVHKKEQPASPASSDNEFEVVTTGSPHTLHSWVHSHRNRSYGGFVDAVCDKAYVVPIWIILLSTIPSSNHLRIIQYAAIIKLILAEISSGCVRFQAYFSSGGVAAPKVEGFDFSTSAVNADHVGKAKQTFEMVGTALFIMPWTRFVGLFFLLLALPLAYESVRRKVKDRVIYVNGVVKPFDFKTLKFWTQAKALGSKLIVGIPGEKMTDMVLNACASTSVDEVIAEAPTRADLMFLEKQGIDFVIMSTGQQQCVTDEVVNAGRCLIIGEDCVCRQVLAKADKKE
ncbi:hypothetical protein MPSEU_000805300 [Mayamaea pseudoterrestris]|nr:hypothetical protein MPSEU_000805300 [Mayamaea pseudoterrestris]